MEQLPRLESRIHHLHELHSLVGAMRSMAASQIREADRAVAGIRRYSEIVGRALVDALQLVGDLSEEARGRTPGGRLLVILGSEHGFVGGLNDRLIDMGLALHEPGEELIVSGSRAATLGRELGLEPGTVIVAPSKANALMTTCRALMDRLVTAARIRLLYAVRGRDGSEQIVPICKTVLPVPPEWLQAAPSPQPPLCQLSPAELLQGLVEEYLFGELSRAVTETFAAENAARLAVMSSASRKIDQRLEELQRNWRQLRQTMITTELLDVIAGAEAQSDSDSPAA